ncbi:hypothetical protein QCD79_33085, partial [Pseudomonas quasicaspiana]|nr:hypothetical protein [Pseudomonas quasicaspiana]
LDSRYFSANKQHSLVSDQFFNLRHALQKDARTIIVKASFCNAWRRLKNWSLTNECCLLALK